uniref:Caspase-8 n=1 Tax=Sander lucioperca TaxID=283035 RepID=A0A8C9XG64_SANLU
MDRLKLSRIDEELVSSEVAALCFLCRDVINRKRLEGIVDAKGLFLRLEEKGLLENDFFLSQLLQTICRADLLNLLETDSRQPEETDANPMLSDYRVMLYRVYEDMTEENLDKMKFLLSNKLGKAKIEACNTALDVFAEMEMAGLLSNTNLHELHTMLLEFDQQLALIIQRYTEDVHSHAIICSIPIEGDVSFRCFCSSDAGASDASVVFSDAEPMTSPLSDHTEYYALLHNPRGLCVVINNEYFLGTELKNRGGTQEDAKALLTVFTRLGFNVVVHDDLTAHKMLLVLRELGSRNFLDDDALVVCVLSHGEKGCVYGIDEKPVSLRELSLPFTSGRAPTLAGKPKLFFIQACQGSNYQRGSLPCPPKPRQEEGDRQSRLEADAGRVDGETVPWDADFLLGMATVPECKSFRNTAKGSIYIQELCRQLMRSAESSEMDDMLTVLTRVNREVSKGEYLNYKQMPEPKYTLTKKLVLKFV